MAILCEAVRPQLTHFVLAQLDPDETVSVVRHLATCSDCAQEEATLRRTSLLLRQWQAAPLREALADEVRHAAGPPLAELAGAGGRRPRPYLSPDSRPLAGRSLTWRERWESLVEAAWVAQRRLAPFAFATVAAATLCAVLVLLRDPGQPAKTAAIFLAGMWCASVANGLIGLVSGQGAPGDVLARQLRIDLRATAQSATLAGALVATLFVIAGLVKSLWLGEYVHAEFWRVPMYSLASFLIVSAAVAAYPRLRPSTVGAAAPAGRVSGALTGLIYSAIAAPLVYIVIGFRLDALWLMAQAAIVVFAVAGGLVGDFVSLRRNGMA